MALRAAGDSPLFNAVAGGTSDASGVIEYAVTREVSGRRLPAQFQSGNLNYIVSF
jgi:hypothetical protein